MKSETESRGFWLQDFLLLRASAGRNWIWSLILSFFIFLSVIYLVLALFAPGAVNAEAKRGPLMKELRSVWTISPLH